MVNPSLDEEIKNDKEVSKSVCKVRLLITGNGICGFGKTEKYFSLFLRHGRSREQGDRTNDREEKGECHSQRFAEEWTTLEGRECEKVFLLVCSRVLDFLLLPTRVLSS